MNTSMDTDARPDRDSSVAPSVSGQTNNNTSNSHNASNGPTTSSPNAQSASGSHGAQIRSRITVVCAECKRLKLRCDRRTPCGSCLKRDTVNRCLYSAAAAEKIDVQSLHNRVLVLEAALAQINTGARGPPNGALLGSSASGRGLNGAIGAAMGGSHMLDAGGGSGAPVLIAIGNSGSSLALALDDVSALWLDHLDVARDLGSYATSGNPGAGALELPPATDPAFSATASPADFFPRMRGITANANNMQSPRTTGAPGSTASPAPSSPHSNSTSSPQSYSGGPLFLAPLTERAVTPALLQLLPHPHTEAPALLHILEHAMCMHPCFNFPHFRQRVDGLGALRLQYPSAPASPSSSSGGGTGQVAFSDLPPAQRPTMSFFAAAAAGFALAAQASIANIKHASPSSSASISTHQPNHPSATSPPPPASIAMKTEPASGSETNLLAATNALLAAPTTCSPDALFALSTQALAAFESTSHYDLDYLIAMILQVLFLLHDGKARIVHVLYPMVGKMVNVAQMMGLGTDPDEYPNQFSLFEAETRRRIWWDVYFYDLFVSDYMALPPSLADYPYTTQLPADVDEHSFSPSSSALPIHMQDDHRTGSSAYFIQKCRLAQLIKNMKKRTVADQQNGDLTVEMATTYEGEVTQWLVNLPAAFKLQMDIDALPTGPPSNKAGDGTEATTSNNAGSTADVPMSFCNPASGRITGSFVPPGLSPLQVAQQCELAVQANRLIIKLFSPFLKRSSASYDMTPTPGNTSSLNPAYILPSSASSTTGGSGSGGQHQRKPPHQAVLATINAAHLIISASRVLHAVWTQHCPAAFQFYSFSRSVFDAAVIAAHAVIEAPTAVYARAALDDVNFALEIMRDPAVNATGRGPVNAPITAAGGANAMNGVEGQPSESVRIVELLRVKAEDARSGKGGRKWEAGTKRKHEDVEVQHILPGFQLPWVGGAAAMPANLSSSPPLASGGMALVPSGAVSNAGSTHSNRPKFNDGASTTSSKYHRPAPYPSAARGRPSKEPAGRRGSASGGSTASGVSRLAMMANSSSGHQHQQPGPSTSGSPSSLRMQTNVSPHSQSGPSSSQQGPGSTGSSQQQQHQQQQHQGSAPQTPHPSMLPMGMPPPPSEMDYTGMGGYQSVEDPPMVGLSQFGHPSSFDSQSMGPPQHPHRPHPQYPSGPPSASGPSQFGHESPMHGGGGMFNSPTLGGPSAANGGMPGLVYQSSTPPNAQNGAGTASSANGTAFFVPQQQQQQPQSAYDMAMMGLGIVPSSAGDGSMRSVPGTPRSAAGQDFGLSMVPEDVGLKGGIGGQRMTQQQQQQQQQQRWQANPSDWQTFDNGYYGS